MLQLANDELRALSLHDSEIAGIHWSSDGNDMRIDVDWLLPARLQAGHQIRTAAASLTCVYASNVSLQLDFRDFMGRPTIYDVSFEPLPHERWRVRVDMSVTPTGHIVLECNDLRFWSEAVNDVGRPGA